MIITANFTNNGVPQDGLTPTIRIINLPNIVDVSGAAMTEVTNLSGAYYYDFTDYNVSGNYNVRCDGGATLSDYDRYTWGGNSDDLEIGTGLTDTSGGVAAIKIKTDNLPDDTSGQMAIIQGLLHKNLYTTAYWDGDDMTGAQIRIYDSAFNAGVHSASGVLLTLGLTGTFAGGRMQTILVIEE